MVSIKVLEIKLNRDLLTTKFLKRGDRFILNSENLLKNKFFEFRDDLYKFIKVFLPELFLKISEEFLFFIEKFSSNMSEKVRGTKRLNLEEKNNSIFLRTSVKNGKVDSIQKEEVLEETEIIEKF